MGHISMWWCRWVGGTKEPSSNEDAEPVSEAALTALAAALQGFSSQYSLLGTKRQHVLGAGPGATVLR